MTELTAIFEKAEDGGYTCWIEEIPEAISEGDTIEEAKANLIDALNLVMEYRREKAEEDLRVRKPKYKKEIIQLAS